MWNTENVRIAVEGGNCSRSESVKAAPQEIALRKIGRRRSFSAATLPLKSTGVYLRVEGGDLDAEVHAWQRAPGAVVGGRLWGPAHRGGGKGVQQIEVDSLVPVGFGLAHRGLAEHIECEADSPARGRF